ncbi:MAG TPA: TolC family protein [Syntrophomonadaceae bacterium]|nr:TolC family protein [Syntrophomonadaceae bacterium]HNX28349.1 TolC family protein [Syntrophomonadaceae bacterium]HPR92719.1 TolC family protein [Syntrophomonadaceae bacterium]
MSFLKKITVLMAMGFIIAGLYSLPAQAEVITIDQAKALASSNSRTLAQYQLNTKKASYQIDQLEQQQTETSSILDSILDQYQDIKQQIADLQEAEGDNTQAISELEEQLDKLEESIDSQIDSISSANDSVEDSENNYEDKEISEANYKKKLDYEVEKLYTSVLNQIISLETAELQQQVAEIELQMENTRLKLGSSTQSTVYEKSRSLTDCEQNITSIEQNIRSAKGTLNDIMGRDYDADLELADFVWTSTLNTLEYSTLLDKALSRYQALKDAKQAIEDAEDELEDTDDFYSSMILTLEIQEKKLALQDLELELSQSVDNLIYEIAVQQQDYKTAQLSCQNAQQQYTWDKKRYELGQISKLTLLNSEISYKNAVKQQAAENYALFLAEHSLELAEKGIL